MQSNDQPKKPNEASTSSASVSSAAAKKAFFEKAANDSAAKTPPLQCASTSASTKSVLNRFPSVTTTAAVATPSTTNAGPVKKDASAVTTATANVPSFVRRSSVLQSSALFEKAAADSVVSKRSAPIQMPKKSGSILKIADMFGGMDKTLKEKLTKQAEKVKADCKNMFDQKNTNDVQQNMFAAGMVKVINDVTPELKRQAVIAARKAKIVSVPSAAMTATTNVVASAVSVSKMVGTGTTNSLPTAMTATTGMAASAVNVSTIVGIGTTTNSSAATSVSVSPSVVSTSSLHQPEQTPSAAKDSKTAGSNDSDEKIGAEFENLVMEKTKKLFEPFRNKMEEYKAYVEGGYENLSADLKEKFELQTFFLYATTQSEVVNFNTCKDRLNLCFEDFMEYVNSFVDSERGEIERKLKEEMSKMVDIIAKWDKSKKFVRKTLDNVYIPTLLAQVSHPHLNSWKDDVSNTVRNGLNYVDKINREELELLFGDKFEKVYGEYEQAKANRRLKSRTGIALCPNTRTSVLPTVRESEEDTKKKIAALTAAPVSAPPAPKK